MKILLACILNLILLVGCIPAKERECDIRNLVLDDAVFENVELGPVTSPFPKSPPESAGREFYFNVINGVVTDHALYTVERYKYLTSAMEEFDESNNLWSDDPWDSLVEYNDLQISADEYGLECGYWLSEFRCRFAARYEEYVIFLGSDISDNGLTQDTFLNATREIDRKMSQCIAK